MFFIIELNIWLGWSAVDEYLSDEVASNSEDEKKIRQAQARAVRKKRATKSTSTGAVKRQRQGMGVAQAAGSPASSNDFFRGFINNRRYQAWHPGPKPTDLCFSCGRPGHWRRNCTQSQSAGNAGKSESGKPQW